MKKKEYYPLAIIPQPDVESNLCMIGLHFAYQEGDWFVRAFDAHEQKELTRPNLNIKKSEGKVAVQLTSSELTTPVDLTDEKNRNRYLLQSTYVKRLFIVPVVQRRVMATHDTRNSAYTYPITVEIKGEKQSLVYYSNEKLDIQTFDFQAATNNHGRTLYSFNLMVDNAETIEEAIAAVTRPEYAHHGGSIGAVWYDITKPIRLIQCGCMHVSKSGAFTCGRPYGPKEHEDGGEEAYGCFAEDYEYGREWCPEKHPNKKGKKAIYAINDGDSNIYTIQPPPQSQQHPDKNVAEKLTKLAELMTAEKIPSSLFFKEGEYLYRLYRGEPVYDVIRDIDLVIQPYRNINPSNLFDPKTKRALFELSAAIVSWERETGRQSLLIFRDINGFSWRADCGKPIPEEITDEELLTQIL